MFPVNLRDMEGNPLTAKLAALVFLRWVAMGYLLYWSSPDKHCLFHLLSELEKNDWSD